MTSTFALPPNVGTQDWMCARNRTECSNGRDISFLFWLNMNVSEHAATIDLNKMWMSLSILTPSHWFNLSSLLSRQNSPFLLHVNWNGVGLFSFLSFLLCQQTQGTSGFIPLTLRFLGHDAWLVSVPFDFLETTLPVVLSATTCSLPSCVQTDSRKESLNRDWKSGEPPCTKRRGTFTRGSRGRELGTIGVAMKLCLGMPTQNPSKIFEISRMVLSQDKMSWTAWRTRRSAKNNNAIRQKWQGIFGEFQKMTEVYQMVRCAQESKSIASWKALCLRCDHPACLLHHWHPTHPESVRKCNPGEAKIYLIHLGPPVQNIRGSRERFLSQRGFLWQTKQAGLQIWSRLSSKFCFFSSLKSSLLEHLPTITQISECQKKKFQPPFHNSSAAWDAYSVSICVLVRSSKFQDEFELPQCVVKFQDEKIWQRNKQVNTCWQRRLPTGLALKLWEKMRFISCSFSDG